MSEVIDLLEAILHVWNMITVNSFISSIFSNTLLENVGVKKSQYPIFFYKVKKINFCKC